MSLPIKGIIFAGCSFTWGQGLYFYKDFESLKIPIDEDKYTFNYKDLTYGHLEYMKSKRFPRLVANHFDTFELVAKYNGGDDRRSCNHWINTIGKNPLHPFEDYSLIVFQLTQPHRSNTFFTYNDVTYEFNPFVYVGDKIVENDEKLQLFGKYLVDNGLDIYGWLEIHIKDVLQLVKNTMIHFENHGIKSLLMTWPEIYVNDIYKDSYLNEKFIDFEYNDIKYNSLETLMLLPEMMIRTDLNKYKVRIFDDHPSMLCHNLIANHIINKINSNKDLW